MAGHRLQCYWQDDGVACAKADWPACGYNWLVNGPVILIWGFWFLLGIYMLQRDGSIRNLCRFDTSRIHDPLAQGLAVALAQRKYGSNQTPRLLRYVKLCAMWAEWPAFTTTPLSFAYNVAGTQGYSQEIFVAHSMLIESVTFVLSLLCGISVLCVRLGMKPSPQRDTLLRRYVYPITFDALYIPLVSTYVRLGTCTEGYNHIPLPGGATCACLNRYGLYWAVGLLGFVVLYASSLYYKMFIEPMGTTMDFRFETSFQIIMVMARTLGPIYSVLVIGLQFKGQKTAAIPVTLGFLICVSFLLHYAYRMQPCIGSGRLPNNIRVLSFSSSLYTTLCVLVYLLTPLTLDGLYAALLSLPLVWMLAWQVNDKRARRFYIPDLSILDLLQERSPQAKLVGTIAALYMDAAKVRHTDYEAIVFHLHSIAKHSMLGVPLCRIYAIRALWFCYIRNFRKAKCAIGEPNDALAIPCALFFKDRENLDRPKSAPKTALTTALQRVKLTRIESIMDVLDVDVLSARHHFSRAGTRAVDIFKSKLRRPLIRMAKVAIATTDHKVVCAQERSLAKEPYFLILLRGKHWICKNEAPEAAMVHHEMLHHMALEVLSQSCAMDDRIAMHEIGLFLLQWYKTTYLRLNKTVYLHILSTLCASANRKLVLDVTCTLHKLCTDGFFLPELWLQNTSFLNNFVLGLGHASKQTVYQCAIVLASILECAEADPKTNLFVLLTPESIGKLHKAFHTWCEAYTVSVALERCCMSLHRIEADQRRKLWHNRQSIDFASHSNVLPASFLKRDKDGAHFDRGQWLNMSMIAPREPTSSTSRSLRREASRKVSRKAAIVFVNDTGSRPSVVAQFQGPSMLALGGTPEGSTAVVPPVDDAKVSYVPTNRTTSKVSTMDRIRRLSMDLLLPSLPRSPTTKMDEYVFVTSAILSEITRRRQLRSHFESELQKTYYLFEEMLMEPLVNGVEWLKDTPTEGSLRRSSTGRKATNNGVLGAFTALMKIYTTAEECALHDYIYANLDRDLVSFFEKHVKPFVECCETEAKTNFWACLRRRT